MAGLDPISAAATLAPLVIGAFRRPKKGPNRYAIINKYRGTRPEGYVTPEDQAAAERTRTRIAGAATAAAGRRRAENTRQVSARGLGGPAAAALEQQASDTEAGGAEEAARTSADQLYQAFQSNLGYARQQNDTAFGAEIGAATHDAALADAQNASFWNSVNEAIPGIVSAWSPAPTATPTASTSGVVTPTTGLPGVAGRQTTVAPVTPAQKKVRGLQPPAR
jgi:hypothetical protein